MSKKPESHAQESQYVRDRMKLFEEGRHYEPYMFGDFLAFTGSGEKGARAEFVIQHMKDDGRIAKSYMDIKNLKSLKEFIENFLKRVEE